MRALYPRLQAAGIDAGRRALPLDGAIENGAALGPEPFERDAELALGAGRSDELERGRLARDTGTHERNAAGLVTRIAHQPAEQAVPERAVRASGGALGELAEAELVRRVGTERDRAAVASLAECEHGHRASARFALGVLPQHDRARTSRTERVRAFHHGQLLAEQLAHATEHGCRAARGRVRGHERPEVVRLDAPRQRHRQHALEAAEPA